jgi:hypothetical protein
MLSCLHVAIARCGLLDKMIRANVKKRRKSPLSLVVVVADLQRSMNRCNFPASLAINMRGYYKLQTLHTGIETADWWKSCSLIEHDSQQDRGLGTLHIDAAI